MCTVRTIIAFTLAHVLLAGRAAAEPEEAGDSRTLAEQLADRAVKAWQDYPARQLDGATIGKILSSTIPTPDTSGAVASNYRTQSFPSSSGLFGSSSQFPLSRSLLRARSQVLPGSVSSSSGVPDETGSDQPHEVLPPGSVSNVPMPGDEASLFHALAYGLSALGVGDEDGFSVRERIAEFIARNPGYIIAGKTVEAWVKQWGNFETVQDYAAALDAGHLTGGVMEGSLFCHIWRVNLDVYQNGLHVQGQRPIPARSRVNSIALKRIFFVDHARPWLGQQPRGTVLVGCSGDHVGEGHCDALRLREHAPVLAQGVQNMAPNRIANAASPINKIPALQIGRGRVAIPSR